MKRFLLNPIVWVFFIAGCTALSLHYRSVYQHSLQQQIFEKAFEMKSPTSAAEKFAVGPLIEKRLAELRVIVNQDEVGVSNTIHMLNTLQAPITKDHIQARKDLFERVEEMKINHANIVEKLGKIANAAIAMGFTNEAQRTGFYAPTPSVGGGGFF